MERTIKDLVLAAREGEQEAFSELYRLTYNAVYQSIRALVKDEDAVQDLVHDSYIKGFQNLDKLDDPEKYQAWMKRLASNTALDYLRKKRPALFSERVDENGEEIDLRHADDDLSHQPEQMLDKKETVRLIQEILGTLSPEQRMALSMMYYEERSIREIAEVMNCSENTVKSRLNYGRKKVEAAVRALEKQGVKLYSMAPMPFLLWLFRAAKAQGIAMETVAGLGAAGAAGAAAAGGSAAGAAAGGSAAGSAAAGTAAGNVAATAAVKTAGAAAGKALATKIVAGALAVSLATGTGAVIHHEIKERRNPQIEQVEPVIDEDRVDAMHLYYHIAIDYREAFRISAEVKTESIDLYWDSVAEVVQGQNPESTDAVWDLEYSRHGSTSELTYIAGDGSVKSLCNDWSVGGIVEMDFQKILSTTLEGEEIRTACEDLDGDGVEEFIVARFYRGELDRSCSIDVYTVRDRTLCRGEAVWQRDSDGNYTWELRPSCVTESTEAGLINIRSGTQYFKEHLVIPEPDLDWKRLYVVGLDTSDIPSGIPDQIFDYDPYNGLP